MFAGHLGMFTNVTNATGENNTNPGLDINFIFNLSSTGGNSTNPEGGHAPAEWEKWLVLLMFCLLAWLLLRKGNSAPRNIYNTHLELPPPPLTVAVQRSNQPSGSIRADEKTPLAPASSASAPSSTTTTYGALNL